MQPFGAVVSDFSRCSLSSFRRYVLYKIGCADNGTTGSSATFTGLCTGCSNGTTAGLCPPPTQAYLRDCQDVLFARSLDGPWARHNLSGFGPGDWDWLHLNSGLESHVRKLVLVAVLGMGAMFTISASFKYRTVAVLVRACVSTGRACSHLPTTPDLQILGDVVLISACLPPPPPPSAFRPPWSCQTAACSRSPVPSTTRARRRFRRSGSSVPMPGTDRTRQLWQHIPFFGGTVILPLGLLPVSLSLSHPNVRAS